MDVTKAIPERTLIMCWTGSWEEDDEKCCCCWHHLFFGLWGSTCSACTLVNLPTLAFQTWEINFSAKVSCGHKALCLKREKRSFWQVTCSHGDYRAVLKLTCFFKTKLEIQILCCSHCVSVPPLTLPPSLLSLSTCRFIFNAFLGDRWAQHPPALPFWSLL